MFNDFHTHLTNLGDTIDGIISLNLCKKCIYFNLAEINAVMTAKDNEYAPILEGMLLFLFIFFLFCKYYNLIHKLELDKSIERLKEGIWLIFNIVMQYFNGTQRFLKRMTW